ncbi:MAG: hypothetical protein WBH20_08290 [Oceanisphaera sp.]|uniref:hypothetical protein n=1 Tax=Oceanisphaera sp. TaxID=1929979 RepID=UPI003C7597AE
MSLKPFHRKCSKGKQRQQGSMLISVLFMILVLGGLMAAMSTLSNQSSQQLVYEVQALKARLAAESILEQQVLASLDEINSDKVNDKEINGCNASIKSLKPEAPRTQVNIIATGQCSTGQLAVIRNIEVEVIANEN